MLTNMEKFFATLALCIMFARVHSQTPQFANPVLDTWSPDPRVLFLGNFYYLSLVNQERNEIRILKSPILSSFRHAEEKVVYRSPAGYLLTDSIELVSLNNSLLMYFSMTNGTTRQIYVMTARDSQNPQGGWNAPTKLLQNVWTEESFHGTVMQTNQNLYFVWTSYNPSKEESIFIAPMTSPTEVVEPVTLLRQPEETWECYRVRCVNEAPSFVYNRGIAYLVFSASQSSDVSCALSYMSIELSKDPMITPNWFSAAGPVFGESDDETVYKACHAGFTTSRDGTETWMVYHATNNASSDALDFSTRIERLNWNKTDGTPIFSIAHGNTYPQLAPSGEPEMFNNPILDNPVTDPKATFVNGQYYLVYSTSGELKISRSSVLTDFRTAENQTIYGSPGGAYIALGGLYEIQQQLYIHFTSNGSAFVTQAEDALNPLGTWSTPISLLDKVFNETVGNQAVLQHNNQLYFVWARGNLMYIVGMLSPTEATEPVVLLKEVTESWACIPTCTMSAPACVYHGNSSYVVFSVNSFGGLNYSLTYMRIDAGKDPLDPTNWVQSLNPVFTGNDDEQVYSAGHALFTTSSDGKETWMVYGAANNITNGTVGPKITHIERITWNDVDEAPVFPKAHGSNHPQPVPTSSVYFSNPIAETNLINPGIIQIGAFYYLLITENDSRELVILKSGKLTNFREAERKVAYRVPSGYSNIQSPEMHFIDENLYIYFAMRNSTHNHRLYVIGAELPSDPLANWGSAIRLNDHIWDVESVDGTIMKHNDKHYLTWASPEPTTGHFSLYMAEMENATSVKAPVALIKEPYESWECSGGCVNNAPTVLSNNEDKTFLVHSVSSLCSENYALTWISIENGKDPLDSINWVKATGTVFQGNENEGVYCAGHASFTQSPDNKEIWMVYQASSNSDTADGFSARIEKISWNEDGTPKFPTAHGPNSTQLIPSNTHIYF